MLCEHLQPLEAAIKAAGIEETYRGQAWSRNCREWVYFRCVFDRPKVRALIALPSCVVDHEHRGTHDGQEAGFECQACHDGIMGSHPAFPVGREFP